MNKYYYIFSTILSDYLLVFLFIVCFFALFLPHKIIGMKNRTPIAFNIILTLAILIQLPLNFFGYWGLGVRYAETSLSKFIDGSLVLLVLLYPTLFFLSMWIQSKNEKIKDLSPSTALLCCLILSPFLYFNIMAVVGRLVGG